MNIEYPKQTKVIKAPSKKSTAEVKSTELQEIKLQLDELETQNKQTQKATTQFEGTAQQVADVSSQVEQNTTAIQTLQTAVGTNTQNISALQTTVGVHTQNVNALQNSKQDVLTAGNNITIDANNVISATDTTYTAGQNVTIHNGEISATDTTYTAGDNISINNGVISATVPQIDTTNLATKTELQAKQDLLTAGTGISINNNVISATGGTTYTAGTGIDITGSTISADTTTLATKTDLQNKQNTLTFDVSPTQNSTNPVTSGGVYSAISQKQDSLTAGTGISITNGVISATGGGGLSSVTASDVDSESATQGQVLTANGQGGASWQTINNNGSGSGSVPNDNIDYSYNPQSITIPSSDPTIYQNYAKFYRRFNKNFTGTVTTCKFIFSANSNSNGILKLKLTFLSNQTFAGTITLFHNNVQIATDTLSYQSTNVTQVFEKEFSNIALSDSNVFYVTLAPTPNSIPIKLFNIEAELFAPNAEVINQISPYNVEYFNGKYYISDCSSGTAKIAEINISDMHNMDNLVWTNTGIECLQYKTAFQTNIGTIGNRIDYYFGTDGQVHVNDVTSNTAVVLPVYYSMIDWFQSTNEKTSFITHDSLYYYNYDLKFTSNTLAYNNTYLYYGTKYYNSLVYATAKYLSEYFNSSSSIKFAVVSSNNATISGAAMHKTSGTPIELGKGTNFHSYYEEINSSRITVCCFAKHYNQIVKYRFRYDTVIGTMTTLLSTNIGNYEEYFEGVNNDYFVVKNGKLKYYKKPQ